MCFSDCRNVSGSLSGDARHAFWETYGYINPHEETLDQPLATLYNLHIASRMLKFPRWAQSSRQRVLTGDLERDLMAARDLIAAIALARA